jgi:Flp pilus assembly pilin Flp
MSIVERVFMTLSLMPSRAKNEKGAAMIEYALLVVGIAVVVGAAAALLGGRIAALFNGLP